MKHLCTKILLAMLMGMMGINAFAHDIEVMNADGVTIYYNFVYDYANIDDSRIGVEVTYRGRDYNSYSDEYTGSVIIPESVTYDGKTLSVLRIGYSTFYKCKSLKSITIPNSVTNIYDFAFSECSSLTSVIIPNSVTSIGHYAFENCIGLTSMTIPNSVTSLGAHVFDGCSNLISVSISNNITTIANDAFADCSSLNSVTIPNSATSIEDYAFYGCRGLTSVTIKVQIPFAISETVFDSGIYRTATLIVPPGSKAAYQTTEGWKNFSNITESDDDEEPETNPVTVTANNYTITYGDALPEFGYTTEGAALSGKPEISCEATATSGAGTYDITISKGTVTNGNVTFVKGTLTINKAALTATAKSYSRKQGEANPTFEIEYSGWKNNEDVSVLTTVPTATTTADVNSAPGTYDITVSGGEAANYDFNYVKGTLTITEDPVTVTATSYTITYGDALPEFGYTIEGAALSGEPEISCEATATSGAGTYDITVTKGTVTNGNVTFVKGTLTINKATLTATAKSYSRKQGEANPTFEIEYSGWKNNEDVSVLTTVPTATTTADANSAPGAYDITVSGGEAANYDFNYVKGTLTITEDPVTVTATSYTITYGDALPEFGYTTEGAALSGEPEISCEATATSGAGTYDINVSKGTVTNGNVTFVKGTLTINKATLTATAKSYTREQGEANPTFEIEYSGWKNNEDVSVLTTVPTATTTADANSAPGTYDITVSGGAAANYDFSYVKGTLTVTAGSYILTYMVDGETYKTVNYDYGATITPEDEPTKEGYTFSGWSEIPETMPAKDVTVTGTFSINKYTLTYMVDGEVYKTYEVEYGASITPETEPTKEGYTFSGWSDIPETMLANDVTVTGTFELTSGTFTLTYVVDGETYKTETYDYGTTITSEAEPTKEGYTFSGWSEIPETMPARDVTVTGYFSVNVYTLTYLVDDEVYKTYEYEYGATITPEEEPTKDDYVFSGWDEIPETMPAYDVTVTGYFYDGIYTLTYVVDGETYKTVTYKYGETIKPEAEPKKEGYTFSGWSEIPKTMPLYDITVTGTFTINKYKLTYTVDGEVYKTYEVEYGTTITPEAEPTKEGHTFSGWSEIPSTMPAHDVTVSGTFSKGAYKLIYMVDGVAYKTISYDYGATISPETEPSKEGYTFSGWSDIPGTMPANDVTVIGSFTINKYTLTYMVDGSEYKTYEVEFGATITPEAEPTKEGYTFSGWSEMPETMPAKDVIVTGTFTVNKYKLVYMIDGNEYKTYEIAYGTIIIPETEPSKDGYTFSGWSEIPPTMPAHDVTVTGSFTLVEISVNDITYKVTGEGTISITGCNQIGEVTIEATVEINSHTYQVTGIADNAFKDNKDMTSVTLPESITTVGENAFNGCSSLFVIKIGKGVMEIGKKAFANIASNSASTRAEDTGLKVYCEADVLPSTATDAFENTPIDEGTLIVKDEMVMVYKYAMPWNGFGSIIGLTTDIRNVAIDADKAFIFDMQGNRIDNVRKGVNIIRTRNGKTKKVMVK